MASGPVGEGDGTRERKRFKEGKVYTRKVFRGPKKTTSVGNTVASATATDKDDNAATTTITNDAETNTNRTDGAHSNTENVLAKLPAPQLEENLAQLEGSSRLVDGITAQVQGSSKLQEGNSPRSQVNSRPEDGNSPQVSSRTKKDGNLPQQQLEDQNLAQPQASSRTEEDNSSQQQLEPQVTSPQPQADSRPEDGTSPQLQLDSRLEEGNLSQQQENLRLEEGNSSQQLVSSPQLQFDSRLEEGSLSQQQENLRLEEGNSSQQLVSSPQLQLDSRLEEGNLSQQQENLRLGEGNSSQQLVTSPQLQLDSRLEEGNLSQQQENLRLEEGNSSQQLVSSRLEEGNLAQPLTQSVSNDTQSGQQDEPSQQEKDVPLSPSHRQGAVPLVNGDVEPQLEDRIKINLSSTSKQEMQKLREKFEGELGVVRSLVRKIEVKQGRVGGYGTSNVLVGNRIANGGGAKRAHSEIASAGTPRQPTRPFHQFNLPMLENSQGISESVEKEKRMPKANQFYHNSEFLLAKDKFPPAESNKKSKVNWKKQGGGEMGYGLQMGPKFFKSCSSLLEKLMKHKHGWVFNSPVDVEGLGLHDYFTIITHPMDLGTVKTRLNKNWYKSPKEFAEDVRLTFHNAMTYNPKGQDVHVMAEQLSKIFEDRWAIIESDYNREMRYGIDYGAAPPGPSPLSRKVPPFPPPALDMRRILDRSESLARTPRPMSITPSSRTPAPKKPKAKDPHKRDMTFEEKQKLSTNLQSLPPEKLDAIVQIIKRRNFALDQHDDEIEVDIDSVDAETLWELDRFVTNYKKGLSKIKRRAELARARANSLQNATQQSQPPPMVGIPKETQADERNVPPSLPMQGGNQAYNRSRSSSSSSSSSDSGSSSSDSDSDSSSASGSDAGSQGT